MFLIQKATRERFIFLPYAFFVPHRMFAWDDKQSIPATLSHQQMNSDEVGVNISHVLIARMINAENTDTHTFSPVAP